MRQQLRKFRIFEQANGSRVKIGGPRQLLFSLDNRRKRPEEHWRFFSEPAVSEGKCLDFSFQEWGIGATGQALDQKKLRHGERVAEIEVHQQRLRASCTKCEAFLSPDTTLVSGIDLWRIR